MTIAQRSLFDDPVPGHCQGAPYQSHSPQSRAAAEQVTPHLGRMQMAVWLWLKDHPGSTDNEIIAGVGGSPNSPRARRIELVRKGMVVPVSVRDGSQTWRVA